MREYHAYFLSGWPSHVAAIERRFPGWSWIIHCAHCGVALGGQLVTPAASPYLILAWRHSRHSWFGEMSVTQTFKANCNHCHATVRPVLHAHAGVYLCGACSQPRSWRCVNCRELNGDAEGWCPDCGAVRCDPHDR